MNPEITVLIFTAASIGFLHTLFGPDHYLPFIVMSRARKWSMVKTMLITFACGVAHVLSSVILGLIGILFGIAVMKLEMFESFRGNLAAWALIGFGLAYFIYGVHMAVRNKPHHHAHTHDDGSLHTHKHTHSHEHAHVHEEEGKNMTPWVLFIIFVLGPCEPLIPLLMYPAAKSSLTGLMLVTGVFGIITIGTMMGIVAAASRGLSLVNLCRFERYSHATAGAAVFLSGMAIVFLGL